MPSLPGQPWSACWNSYGHVDGNFNEEVLAPWATRERVLELGRRLPTKLVRARRSLPGQPWSACWNSPTRGSCTAAKSWLAPWATMERVLERCEGGNSRHPRRGSLPGQPWSACWNLVSLIPLASRSLGNHGARVGTEVGVGPFRLADARSLGNHGARVGTASTSDKNRSTFASRSLGNQGARVGTASTAPISARSSRLAPWATKERVLDGTRNRTQRSSEWPRLAP